MQFFHQKVVEIAAAPQLDETMGNKMNAHVLRLCCFLFNWLTT